MEVFSLYSLVRVKVNMFLKMSGIAKKKIKRAVIQLVSVYFIYKFFIIFTLQILCRLEFFNADDISGRYLYS